MLRTQQRIRRMMFGTKLGGLAAAAAIAALSGLATDEARAEPCIEQIVALQQRLKATDPSAAPKPPTQPQSIGAQIDRQPTPSSVAQAEGNLPAPVGPAAALNAAQNFQAAGDEPSCLKAVAEARKMMDGK